MTFQQAPFFLGQNDELVEISSALTDWCAHFKVCEFVKNYYNQNVKIVAYVSVGSLRPIILQCPYVSVQMR